MALQLILGPSGSGKSEYIYDEIIKRTMQDERENFIVLVPEQYSLAIQRKIVKKHPRGGSFQIDVIGFNRLAYRIFDELNIKPAKVLEDFGKSMLLRLSANERKSELSVFAGSLDKTGFIDEVKSLMSEVYQYDIPRERLRKAWKELQKNENDNVLAEKLQDMLLIFETFEEKKGDAFIVAEQILELLTKAAGQSQLIQNSEIVLDGFTGFTPIQLKLLSVLLKQAKNVTVLLTIDAASYKKQHVGEHELFALTRQTIEQLYIRAHQEGCPINQPIFMDESECKRWKTNHPLAHLEKNLFRYPYHVWEENTDNISITVYDNPLQELTGVAEQIRGLVMNQGYRYREIAVVSGDLEATAGFVERIFPSYEIPFFIDMTKPVKNHPCVDAISHVLRIVEENFSYDSVFAFLKSGVVRTLSSSEIELLENYVLFRGRKGIRSWSQTFQNSDDGAVEEIRTVVMDILQPFYKAVSGGKKKVSVFVDAVYQLMDVLSFEEQFDDAALYEKVCQIFDKMVEIMPDEMIDVHEFDELFAVGMKDISLGMVPPTLDMVVVGDITRTRLSEIRTLFIVGVNDGVIPKRTKRSQIISDREKERLGELGIQMAPTERVNSYTEHFYLYQNMTKPSDSLHLSYVSMSAGNEPMRPSYILERIRRIFPTLCVFLGQSGKMRLVTKSSGIPVLISGLQELFEGNYAHEMETLQLYKLYKDEGDEQTLNQIRKAMQYQNIPQELDEAVTKLIKLRDMSMSVSKLEQYAQCAYAFFLKYILRIKERKVHGIDNRNVGVILHGAMEQMFCYVRDHLDNHWDEVDDGLRDEKTEMFVRENFAREYEGQDIDDGQYEVLLKSLIRIAKRTMQKMQTMMDGEFEPRFLEQKFRKEISVGDETFDLVGVIDRGDLHINPDNHKVFLRVIDYKSGAHDFDLGNLYEGLELQLAIYTEVMSEIVDQTWNQNRQPEDRYEIVADSMYYYHMQDPYVQADTEMQAEQVREKKLMFQGLERKDGDDFRTIVSYAEYKAGNLAAKIKSGMIDKNPEKNGNKTACDYCMYKEVCRFDEKYGKNRYHNVFHSAKEREQLLEEMRTICLGQQNNNR